MNYRSKKILDTGQQLAVISIIVISISHRIDNTVLEIIVLNLGMISLATNVAGIAAYRRENARFKDLKFRPWFSAFVSAFAIAVAVLLLVGINLRDITL